MSFAIPSMKAFIQNISTNIATIVSTLLLHFDGTSGDTTTVDSSLNAVAITINKFGATFPQLSNVQVKFGTTSFRNAISTAVGYITFPNSSLFNFGSNDWTIDFWWQPISIPTSSTIVTNYIHFNTSYVNGSVTIPGILIKRNNRLDAEFAVSLSTDGSTQTTYTTSYGSWSTGTWYHIALERYGSNINFYINGSKISMSTTFSGSLYYNATNPICFGGGFSTTFNTIYYTSSYYDELRIVNGTAIYKGASFTPPTSAYTS